MSLSEKSLKVIQNLITALQIRLNKPQNLFLISKIDLGIGFDIKLIYKFTKSITKISSKLHKPKIYNEVINHLIYRNR